MRPHKKDEVSKESLGTLGSLVQVAMGAALVEKKAEEGRALLNSVLEKLKNFLNILAATTKIDPKKIFSHNGYIWSIKTNINDALDPKLLAKKDLSAHEKVLSALADGITDSFKKSSKSPEATLYNCTMYLQDWLERFAPPYKRSHIPLFDALNKNKLANPAETPIISQKPPEAEEEIKMRNTGQLKFKFSSSKRAIPPKPESPKRDRDSDEAEKKSPEPAAKKSSPEKVVLRTKEDVRTHLSKLSENTKQQIQKALAEFYRKHKMSVEKDSRGFLAFNKTGAYYEFLPTDSKNSMPKVRYTLHIDSGNYESNKEMYEIILDLTERRSKRKITTSHAIFMSKDSDDWKEKCVVELKKTKCLIPADEKPLGSILVFGTFVEKLMEMFPIAENLVAEPEKPQENNAAAVFQLPENKVEKPGNVAAESHETPAEDHSSLEKFAEHAFRRVPTQDFLHLSSGSFNFSEFKPPVLGIEAQRKMVEDLRKEAQEIEDELKLEEESEKLAKEAEELQKKIEQGRQVLLEKRKRSVAAIANGGGIFASLEQPRQEAAQPPAEKRPNTNPGS